MLHSSFPNSGFSPSQQSDAQNFLSPPPSPSVKGMFIPSHIFPGQDFAQEDSQRSPWSTQMKRSEIGKKIFDDYGYSARFTPERTSNVHNTPSATPLHHDRRTSSPTDRRNLTSLRSKDELPPPASSIYDTEELDASYLINESTNSSVLSTNTISVQSKALDDSSFTAAPLSSSGFTIQDSESAQILDERWVTVFGFSVDNSSFVLRQFQKYGNIVRYVPGEGNWIHIQYETKFQAQKALTKNGKILDRRLMVGVSPCLDSAAIQSARSFPSELQTIHKEANSNLRITPRVLNSDTRPLPSYNPSSAPPESANKSVISKMFEYVFSI